jgi:hypothetical protein
MSDTEHPDNIASVSDEEVKAVISVIEATAEAVDETEEVDDEATNEYMKCFEVVSDRNEILKANLVKLNQAPDQLTRIRLLVARANEQQKYNDELYDLAVAMSNFLGSK